MPNKNVATEILRIFGGNFGGESFTYSSRSKNSIDLCTVNCALTMDYGCVVQLSWRQGFVIKTPKFVAILSGIDYSGFVNKSGMASVEALSGTGS